MLREDGDTGEPPAQGTCLDEVAGGVEGEIRARTRPQEATIDHRCAEGSIRPPLSNQISAPVEMGDPASSSGVDMIQHGLSLNRRHIASTRQARVGAFAVPIRTWGGAGTTLTAPAERARAEQARRNVNARGSSKLQPAPERPRRRFVPRLSPQCSASHAGGLSS